jgi:hypothetical protein
VYFVILNLVNPDFIIIMYHPELTSSSYEMILKMSSGATPPDVGELFRRFGNALDSIFKGVVISDFM